VCDPTTLADINTIARSLGVAGWDVTLIGDGAGHDWSKPAGWACILIDRHAVPNSTDAAQDARKLFMGGMNFATCEIAELMPYIQGMLWYDRYYGKTRRTEQQKGCLDVLIITDRQSIAQQGVALQSGRDRVSDICRRQPLWATMIQLEMHGYRFIWVWKKRDKIALNSIADRMADAAKCAAANALAIAHAHVRDDVPEGASEEDLIYHYNSAAFPKISDVNSVLRRRYSKKTGFGRPGFDPGSAPV
jgi:hypothetical protein